MLTTLVLVPLACCAVGYWTLRRPSLHRAVVAVVAYLGALALMWATDEQGAAFLVAIAAVLGMWLATIPDDDLDPDA